MQTSPVHVERLPDRFQADDRRVITRFFTPGTESRIRAVLNRVMALPEETVVDLLQEVERDFGGRHPDIESIFRRHFGFVERLVPDETLTSDARRMLAGAYFTMEYAIESAALFNPSIVVHPDQSDLRKGDLRFILSLRATGEGHISSIVFREGVLSNGSTGRSDIRFKAPGRFCRPGRLATDRTYDRHLFYLKMMEIGAYRESMGRVFDRLDEYFSLDDLERAIHDLHDSEDRPEDLDEVAGSMRWLAHSNYRLYMPHGAEVSELVIFPTSENERKGLEDLRLVRFVDEDESVRYFGTYTAFDGFRILPQLIETSDFNRIEVHTLNGKYVQNKGMALFPRKIDGRYHMVSRVDGENMYLMRSDNVHFWNECMPLQAPRFPWEFVQIGNCGSPIETEEGWLLLTHGVGPMRKYCIGVSLLDRDDPSRVIANLADPLIVPQEDERDGYVPNVVYSCGALIHGRNLIIPYAISDIAVRFAQVSLDELLEHLLKRRAAA